MDYFDQFAAHLRAADRSEKTVVNYLADLRLFGRWFEQTNGEPMTPQAVTPIDLREYRAHLVNVRRLAPASVNRKLASLRAFLGWAKDTGLIESNPAEGIKGVREQELAPRWLEKKEQYALLRAVQRGGKERDIAIITLLLHTGLRVSELCALTPDDVQMSDRKGQLTVQGKGGKVRIVPLNADARKALSAWLEVRPADGPPTLFCGQRGDPLSPRAVQRIIAKYARLANLEGRTEAHVRQEPGQRRGQPGEGGHAHGAREPGHHPHLHRAQPARLGQCRGEVGGVGSCHMPIPSSAQVRLRI